MKGGKGGRQRRTGAKDAPIKAGQTAPKKSGAKFRAKSEAPKKGERSKSFGWRSSSEE